MHHNFLIFLKLVYIAVTLCQLIGNEPFYLIMLNFIFVYSWKISKNDKNVIILSSHPESSSLNELPFWIERYQNSSIKRRARWITIMWHWFLLLRRGFDAYVFLFVPIKQLKFLRGGVKFLDTLGWRNWISITLQKILAIEEPGQKISNFL